MKEMDEYFKNSPMSHPSVWGAPITLSTGNVSPTDPKSKGMYEYQEPEQDEQGTLYGYKVLIVERETHYGYYGMWSLDSEQIVQPEVIQEQFFVSPRYPAKWRNGKLTSDREPSENSMHGIHFTKRSDHPELDNYMKWSGDTVLVKCALSGTVVETEQGFRAQHAKVIGVHVNGHWQNYQNTQEHPRSNPHRDSDQDYYRW
jgi:hypothetical protein